MQMSQQEGIKIIMKLDRLGLAPRGQNRRHIHPIEERIAEQFYSRIVQGWGGLSRQSMRSRSFL